MKNLFFFTLLAFSLSAIAGEKGNGEHPLSQVDDAFISERDELCPLIMSSTINPDTITFTIEGIERTYQYQVLRDYCSEL